MASRKSSILKPPKTREPLHDLNQLLPYNDDEETTTITGLTKRRVSFASINKVKEFESAAECVTLLNTPAYDERFSSVSSDSCHSSVLSLSHTDSQKMIMREVSAREELAVEEEIELTETVGGKIYESAIKNPVDSSMEYTAPCYSNLNQPEKTVLYQIPNQERTDCETSCMETTEVITNNMFSEALISQTYTDAKYEEKAVAFECHDMEISPYREVQPVSRKSIFDRDRPAPTRKSIFDLPTPQSGFHFRDNEANGYLATNRIMNEEIILMDTSLLPVVHKEENLPSRTLNNTIQKVNYGAKRSIFEPATPNPVNPQTIDFPPSNLTKVSCHFSRSEGPAAHNLSSPMLSQTVRNNSPYHNLSIQQLPTNQTKYNKSSMEIVSQEIETNPRRSLKQNEAIEGSSLLGDNQNNVRCTVSDFQSGCPGGGEIGNKTRYDNSAMQPVSQEVTAMIDYETFNKTRYNNSNMQLASQEENAVVANKTGHSISNALFNNQERDTMNLPGITHETGCNDSNMLSDCIEGNVIDDHGMVSHENSNMHLLTWGENVNDLQRINDQKNCNTSNMQLDSMNGKEIDKCEMISKSCHENFNFHPTTQEGNNVDLDGLAGNADCNDSNMQSTSLKENVIYECEVTDKICGENSNIHSVTQEGPMLYLHGNVSKTSCKNFEMITCPEDSIKKSTDYEENSIDLCEISDEIHRNNLNPQVVDLGEDVTTGFQNVVISEENTNDYRKDEEDTMHKDVNEDKIMCPMSSVTLNSKLFNDVDEGLKTQDMEITQLNVPEEKRMMPVDCKENAIKPEIGAQKLSCENNSSGATSDSNSPLTVGVNFSIFQKNKETRVEFSGTIDSNKRERSKSISNVKVNIINNKVKKEDQNIQKLRFSMPATKTKFDETKPRVYASFIDVDVASNQKEEKNLAIFNDKSLDFVDLQSSVLQNESPVPHENFAQLSEENREQTCAKKRLSSEMLCGKDDEEIGSSKRRSISTLQSCEMVTEMMIRGEKNSSPVEKKKVNTDIREVCTSTHVEERRESIIYGNQETFIVAENVFVETCSKIQTSTCVNGTNDHKETIEETPAPFDRSFNENTPESPNTPNSSNVIDGPPAEEGENFNVEIVPEITTDETCPKKSFVATNFSSKSSLSDLELPTKDRSVELRSDNESERWLAHGHSTPRRKRSIKSLGSHSALEDDLIDSLNNPSIVVHIGDSFSRRSLDSGSESVSTLETREDSGGDSGANVNCIETVPSDNVSKVNFVSDWLQNRTGKTDKLVSSLENHSSSSNKVIACEKNAMTNSCELPKSAMENQAEDVSANDGQVLPSETGAGSFTSMYQEIESGSSEDRPKDNEQVFKETERANSTVVVESNGVFPEIKSPDLDVMKNSAVDEIIFEKQNLVDSATTTEQVIHESLLLQDEVVLEEPEFERKSEQNCVEPVDNALTEEQGCPNRTDCEEEIDLDLMDISSDNIDEGKEEKRFTDAGIIPHSVPAFETLKNEEAVENVKRKILEKIREEYLSDNSDWRTKSVTSNEWTFQLSEFRGLGWSLCLPMDVTVKIMPALVVKIEPCSTKCSASFRFINGPLPDRYCEVMEIGIRALRQKCQKKIKTICRTVEDVPCLLKSLVEDVTWMVKFSKDLKRIGGLEDVRYKNGKALFNVASYENLILFRVHVDLNDLQTLSVNDVKVEQQIGKIEVRCGDGSAFWKNFPFFGRTKGSVPGLTRARTKFIDQQFNPYDVVSTTSCTIGLSDFFWHKILAAYVIGNLSSFWSIQEAIILRYQFSRLRVQYRSYQHARLIPQNYCLLDGTEEAEIKQATKILCKKKSVRSVVHEAVDRVTLRTYYNNLFQC